MSKSALTDCKTGLTTAVKKSIVLSIFWVRWFHFSDVNFKNFKFKSLKYQDKNLQKNEHKQFSLAILPPHEIKTALI